VTSNAKAGLEILVVSKKTWDALAPADQALVKKFAREAQLEERTLWQKYEKDAMDKAKTAGIQITEVADKKPFQVAVKPVWKSTARSTPT
jgi:TRAP-type C4-dicarboxylate transport system substrate-binding protein